MKFNAILNGVKIQKEIPTGWEQVTFRQFLQLKSPKELNTLSVFTGIEPETLKSATIKNLSDVIASMSFVKFAPDLFRLPKSVGGYEVRQDLGFEPYGRYVDIKDIIDKHYEKKLPEEELLNQYPLFAAIYTYQGEYKSHEAEKNVDQFYNAPCTEVLALGNFLLMRLIGLNNTTGKTFRTRLTLLRKWRLVFQLWRARLAFTVRYFIWKKKHPSTAKS